MNKDTDDKELVFLCCLASDFLKGTRFMNKCVSPDTLFSDSIIYETVTDNSSGEKNQSTLVKKPKDNRGKTMFSRSSLRRRQIVRAVVRHHDLLARTQFDPARRSRQRALADLYRRFLGDNDDASLDNARMALLTMELRANLAALMSLAPERNLAEALDMTLRTLREETLALRGHVEKVEGRLMRSGIIGPEIAH